MQQGPIKKTSAIDKGIFTSLAILAIALIAFGGLKLWTSRIQSQKAAVDGQTAAETRGLEGSEANRVADFYKRQEKIGVNIASESNPAEALGQLEKSVIPGSAISSLDSSSGALSLKISADNFLTAAKQLLALKMSDYFSGVKITELSRDTEGKVILSLAMHARSIL